MPHYPGAKWRPVDRYQVAPLKVRSAGQRRLVLHTAVSSAESMHDFFNVAGKATPHFYVNDRGDLEQYIDTDFCGTANLHGNFDSICVESSDEAGTRHTWTLAQVESIARLAAWLNKTHGIPLIQLPNSRPGSTGIGWHRHGIDGDFADPPGHLLGGRVEGGEVWTLSPGKVCPFDGKILGAVHSIIPRAREVAGSPQGDEVTPEDLQKFQAIVDSDGDKTRAQLAKAREEDTAHAKMLKAKIASLRALVTKLPKGATNDQIKADLESLDVEFKVVVADTPETGA